VNPTGEQKRMLTTGEIEKDETSCEKKVGKESRKKALD